MARAAAGRGRGEQVNLDVDRPLVDAHRPQPPEGLVELGVAALAQELRNGPVDVVGDADRVDHQVDVERAHVGIVGLVPGEQRGSAAADDRHRVGEACQDRPELEQDALRRHDRRGVVAVSTAATARPARA